MYSILRLLCVFYFRTILGLFFLLFLDYFCCYFWTFFAVMASRVEYGVLVGRGPAVGLRMLGGVLREVSVAVAGWQWQWLRGSWAVAVAFKWAQSEHY
jgi:hypothetical protein